MTKCTTPSCELTTATLFCPICAKQGLQKAPYCTQECYKKDYTRHKNIHLANPFPRHVFTGTHRPVYPLSQTRIVPKHIPRPDYAEDGVARSEQSTAAKLNIPVLSPAEITKYKEICKLGREVLDLGGKAVKAGITTDEIDRIIHEATIARDAYPSPLNYANFPKSTCTSVNEVICHGIPDQYVLKEGDIVNIDVSLYKDGFHTDLNETYLVGKVDDNSYHLVNSTRECLKRAIEAVKPGALYRDLGNVIEGYIKTCSPSLTVVRSYCGHGVGRLFHGPPSVPHYGRSKAVGAMKAGHVFTIEPMINAGDYRDDLWPDRWTAVTVDGKRSAQFEHTILVTETGYEVLTKGFEKDTVMDGLERIQ